jgi:protein-S-isoprenylcysteine O-methyltransferase Ste14
MTAFHYAILAAGPVLWFFPFLLVRRKFKGASTLDRRARWGVALEGLGYTVLWQGPFWTRSLEAWQTALALALFAVACAISWTSAFALGRQHRVDAALESDHRLIRSGPYRLVRHPIYTSMIAVLVGTGILIAPWYLMAPALTFFLLGTAIRVRVEDRLLESRFGEEFRQYRRTVPAFIPFVG